MFEFESFKFGLDDVTSNNDGKNAPQGMFLPIIESTYKSSSLVNRNKRLSPTTGAGHCPRQSVLSGLFEFSNGWNYTSELYARLGVTVEDYLAKGLGDVVVGQNIRLPDQDFALGGELDIAVILKNKFYVIESKSCGAVPTTPKSYQLSQLKVYMAYFGCDGVLTYISREVMDKYGNLKYAEFVVPYNKEDAIRTMTKIFMGRLGIDNEKLPMMNLEKQADCGFCPFTKFCWYNDESGYPIEKMNSTEYIEYLTQAEELARDFLSPEKLAARRLYLYDKIDSNIFVHDPSISFEKFLMYFDF